MLVAFTLSMPGVSSWDGRWTGEGKLYASIRSLPPERARAAVGNYRRSWSDGWSARVDARIVGVKEAERLRHKSAGFCGYDWMVNSIIDHGRIA